MTSAAPAPSLDELDKAWRDAARRFRQAHEAGADEARLADLDAAVDRAYARWARQDRLIKVAAAGGRGYWL